MEDLQALFDKSSDAPSEENQKVDLLIEAQNAILEFLTIQAMESQPRPFEFLSKEHFTERTYAEIFEILDKNFKDGTRFSCIPYMNTVYGEYFTHFLSANTSLQSPHMVTSMAYSLDDALKYRKISSCVDKLQAIIKSGAPMNKLAESLDTFQQDVQIVNNNPFAQNYTYTHREAYNEFLNEYLKPEENKIITGLQSLDDYIGGFLAGDLVIIGGRPGMGKTAFLIMLIANAALSGAHILNFSLEMSNKQTMSRFLSLDHYGNGDYVSYTNLTKRNVDGDKVMDMVDHSMNKPCNIYHNYDASLTVDGIINYAERKAKELSRDGKKLDMICIDYLQIIQKDTSNRNENELIGDITTKLKRFAKKLQVPILLLSQLNRKVEEATTIEEKRPNNSHLRQSGSIEQDADMILFPFRPAQYEKNLDENMKKYKADYMEVIVSKNRQGDTGIAKARCVISANYICDRPEGDDGLTGNIIEKKSKRGSL